MWDWLRQNGGALAAAVMVIGLILNQAGKLEDRLDGIERGIVSLGSQLKTIETRIDGVDRRLDDVDRRLDGVESWFDVFESSVSDRLNVTEGSIQHLEKQIIEILAKVNLITTE